MTQPSSTAPTPAAYPPVVRPRQSVISVIVPFLPIVLAVTAAFIARAYYPSGVPGMGGMALMEGMRAPDFALQDAHQGEGQRVRLAELTQKSPVLVVFYLGYNCSRCMSHLSQIAQDDALNDAHVQVVAISPWTSDQTRTSIQSFGDFPFPLLADPDSSIAQKYGLVDKQDTLMHGMFLIDTQQKIVWMERSMEPFQELDVIVQRASALQPK